MPRTQKQTKKTEKELVSSKQDIILNKEDNLLLPVYNLEGEEISSLSLPKEIFKFKVNDKLLSQAVRVYLANQRQGTASTKDRGEVSGSTRKIYRQKGTGRARHGSIKAPIFVGGGIVGGPKPRDYSLKINKKQKKQALFGSLSLQFRNNNILIFSDKVLKSDNLKTKLAFYLLKKLKIDNKKVLFVFPDIKNNFYLSLRNIPKVSFVNSKSINFYEVLRNQKIVFFESSLEEIKKIFVKK